MNSPKSIKPNSALISTLRGSIGGKKGTHPNLTFRRLPEGRQTVQNTAQNQNSPRGNPATEQYQKAASLLDSLWSSWDQDQKAQWNRQARHWTNNVYSGLDLFRHINMSRVAMGLEPSTYAPKPSEVKWKNAECDMPLPGSGDPPSTKPMSVRLALVISEHDGNEHFSTERLNDALDVSGWSKAPATDPAATGRCTITDPPCPPPSVGGVKAKYYECDNIHITWPPPPKEAIQTSIYLNGEEYYTADPQDREKDAENLDQGKNYSVEVRHKYSEHGSITAGTANAYVPDHSPPDISGLQADTDCYSVDLSWEPEPESDNPATAIQINGPDESSPDYIEIGPDNTSYTYDGLDCDTDVSIDIRRLTDCGESPWATASTQTPDCTPAPVEGLHCADTTQDTITWEWDAADLDPDEDAEEDYYPADTIEFYLDGEHRASLDPDRTSYQTEELDPDTLYQAKVYRTNECGKGKTAEYTCHTESGQAACNYESTDEGPQELVIHQYYDNDTQGDALIPASNCDEHPSYTSDKWQGNFQRDNLCTWILHSPYLEIDGRQFLEAIIRFSDDEGWELYINVWDGLSGPYRAYTAQKTTGTSPIGTYKYTYGCALEPAKIEVKEPSS